jgi:hypothetical protein
VIPIQLAMAVVENGSDVSPFSPLPILLCALCDLCGIPPHPDPKTFSDGLKLENLSVNSVPSVAHPPLRPGYILVKLVQSPAKDRVPLGPEGRQVGGVLQRLATRLF